MKAMLESSTFLESKKFLRLFIRKIEYTTNEVGIEFTVPANLGNELTGAREVFNLESCGSRGRIRTCDLAVNSRNAKKVLRRSHPP